jgi:tripartite-type tricarboxylate transporter receptor subunit TctC
VCPPYNFDEEDEMTTFTRRAALLAAAALPVAARAQERFPSRPITIVVGFAPGGSLNDIMARVIAPHLAKVLNTSVVVENRVGAGGLIASNSVLTGAHDGYTLMIGNVSQLVMNLAVHTDSKVDLENGFASIGLLSRVPLVLAVHASVPASTLPELVAYAKANPGKLNYGTAGKGSGNHVVGEHFRKVAGVKLVPVHYRGASDSGRAVLTGEVQLTFDNATTLMPGIQSGKIKVLGVAGDRLAAVPQVRTMAEQGLPFEASSWQSLMAPRGVPKDRLEVLQAALKQVVADREFRAQVDKYGLQLFPDASPQAADQFIARERATWVPIGKAIAAGG